MYYTNMKPRMWASVALAIIILITIAAYLSLNPTSNSRQNIPPPPPPEVRAKMRAEIERRLQAGLLKVPEKGQAQSLDAQITHLSSSSTSSKPKK